MPLTPESQRTLAKLANADMRKIIRTDLRHATQPIVAGVRKDIRSAGYGKPSKGNLRAILARAISKTVRATAKGLYVSIDALKKGGYSNLASVAEGVKEWHHPTYGHEPQVNEAPLMNFYDSVARYEASVIREMEKSLAKFEKTL